MSTTRSLIAEAENRLRSTLAIFGVVHPSGMEPLVQALLHTSSVTSTLIHFDMNVPAIAPLREALELIIGLGYDGGDADHE